MRQVTVVKPLHELTIQINDPYDNHLYWRSAFFVLYLAIFFFLNRFQVIYLRELESNWRDRFMISAQNEQHVFIRHCGVFAATETGLLYAESPVLRTNLGGAHTLWRGVADG